MIQMTLKADIKSILKLLYPIRRDLKEDDTILDQHGKSKFVPIRKYEVQALR